MKRKDIKRLRENKEYKDKDVGFQEEYKRDVGENEEYKKKDVVEKKRL